MSATLHSDLVILAAVAWEYDQRNIADSLYCLAQACSHLTPPMSSADLQLGLQLCGLDSFRIVAPGLEIPDMIWDALDAGHVCLAQVRGKPVRKTDYWCVLCGKDGDRWIGLTVTNDWLQCSLSSHYGVLLTGHYVAVARTLPDWEPAP